MFWPSWPQARFSSAFSASDLEDIARHLPAGTREKWIQRLLKAMSLASNRLLETPPQYQETVDVLLRHHPVDVGPEAQVNYASSLLAISRREDQSHQAELCRHVGRGLAKIHASGKLASLAWKINFYIRTELSDRLERGLNHGVFPPSSAEYQATAEFIRILGQ